MEVRPHILKTKTQDSLTPKYWIYVHRGTEAVPLKYNSQNSLLMLCHTSKLIIFIINSSETYK